MALITTLNLEHLIFLGVSNGLRRPGETANQGGGSKAGRKMAEGMSDVLFASGRPVSDDGGEKDGGTHRAGYPPTALKGHGDVSGGVSGVQAR